MENLQDMCYSKQDRATEVYTLHNEHGEPFTISRAALLENLIALEFPHTDGNIQYREILRNHIGRARRLINALCWLTKDRDGKEAQEEYRAALQDVEADCLYYKLETI